MQSPLSRRCAVALLVFGCSPDGGDSGGPQDSHEAGVHSGGAAGEGSGGSAGTHGAVDGGGGQGGNPVETTPRSFRLHTLTAGREGGSGSTVHIRTQDGDCSIQSLSAACVLESCPVADTGTGSDHFGSITVSSTGGALTSVPTSAGAYPETGLSGALWQPGESVRFLAEGGGLPGFDESLVGPGEFVVTSGPPPQPFVAPFQLTWTGAEHASVLIALAVIVDGESIQVRCSAPGDTGRFTIEPDIVTHIPGPIATLFAAPDNRRDLRRGPEDIRLIVRGVPYRTQIVLE